MFESNYRKNRERTFNINLDITTKRYLHGYMEQELHYFNTLINEFNSKLRVLSTEIENIKNQTEQLWLTVAQTGINIRNLPTSFDAWPSALTPFKTLITGGLINERMLILFDIAATKAVIHPSVRKAIASEVLHWVQPQAFQIAESNKNSLGQMRSPIQMLQPSDITRKRHLQLFNDMVEFTYNNETNSTLVKIPYTKSDIIVEGYNLTKEPHDNIIIRQQPGLVPANDTAWQITLKEGTGKYLLNLSDMAHGRRKK